MRETTQSIAVWADQTFGAAPSAFRVATRANEELAELLRAISAGKPTAEIAEEAADTAIVLARLGHMIGADVLKAAKAWLISPRGYPMDYAVKAHHNMGALLGHTLGNSTTVAGRAALATCIGELMNVCSALGHDLLAEIDRKMEVNRTRQWKLDGTGHGYHERVRA